MHDSSNARRHLAEEIWRAGVKAVLPSALMPVVLRNPSISAALASASRIIVVGAGKAGAAMSAALAKPLAESGKPIVGLVNVPNETVTSLPIAIELHGARPAASNQPTEAGVAGTRRMLELLRSAGPEDVCLVLVSGGGSALLPAPCAGITLEQKQRVTLALHACGASINEMNCVRKHLSAIKGGRLAEAFKGRSMIALILSDVIGDPLDVIASGPTVADPTTFADALEVLRKYGLLQTDSNASKQKIPAEVIRFLEEGAAGRHPETLKQKPNYVHNIGCGNNELALDCAKQKASDLGFRVHSLGSDTAGDTRAAAADHARIAGELLERQKHDLKPICLLSGGETTVDLGVSHGKGGRNQEFALTMLTQIPANSVDRVTILAGGTDGEDGPTDAAGGLVDAETLLRAGTIGLSARDALQAHDVYPFLNKTGSLFRTGLTQTNVMDLRVVLLFANSQPAT
jgi:hydroxypyruvate reductase/glycerate 2-kinase